MYATTFTVVGRGRFPTDMLRYDACFPVGGGSASNIADCDSNTMMEDRRVTLCRYTASKRDSGNVTERRWESFGWRVDVGTIEVRKLG